MDVARDMCDITVENADGTLRYFAAAPMETGKFETLYRREDLEWSEQYYREIRSEFDQLLAKESYEALMDVESVNQLVKVADSKVLFTGFVDETVVVAAFDRGVLTVLPDVVSGFRAYMLENDVDFTSLEM